MKKMVLERSFSAPQETVWEALTHEEALKKWWYPPGLEASYISVDLRHGGIFRYCFRAPDGKEFWGRWVYQTIEEPRLLSWLDTFTDSSGNPVPASHYGMSGKEIGESLVEFSLSEEHGITTLKMVGENPHDDSIEESMKAGWNGMFDNLQTFLEKQ